MRKSPTSKARPLPRLECAYCQSSEARLYRLPMVGLLGELTGLAVCSFCYIRLAGSKPRPATALSAASTLEANGSVSRTDCLEP